MSNPLQVNPETGFLESPSNNGPISLQRNYFNSERKTEFLSKADEFIDQGKFPPIHLICKSIGISSRTFETHVQADKAFKAAWDDRRLALKSLFTSELGRKAMKDMGTLANLAMLRYLESNTWLPETRVNHVSDSAAHKSEYSTVFTAIDAEIVPNSPEIPDNSSAPAEQGSAQQ